MTEDFELTNDVYGAVAALERDVRAAAGAVDRDQARFLVDTYYRLQLDRIALGNQVTSLDKAEKPVRVIGHFFDQFHTLEKQMVSVLGVWAKAQAPGAWALGVKGIGPVLAAGVCAHIDITRAPTVGHIWRFAGLDPTVKWEKGQKRPYNADLKVLCWKIGDSFVKVSGREGATYGKLYRERKEYELARDERGGNAEAAAETLTTKKIQDKATRAYYESGHLPPGRLDLRARRWAVKLFLAHFHEIAYIDKYDKEPPLPYPIAILGHAHKIDPESRTA